jgi:1,4-dihydroxy-2-naphthoate octaprenyltransferase
METDRGKKIHTLPVILGERNARYTTMMMLIAQFFVVGYLVWIGYFSPALLVVLLAAFSLRRIWTMFRQPRPETPPEELPEGVWPLYFVAAAFWYTRRFGAFFLAGLVIDLVVSRM